MITGIHDYDNISHRLHSYEFAVYSRGMESRHASRRLRGVCNIGGKPLGMVARNAKAQRLYICILSVHSYSAKHAE